MLLIPSGDTKKIILKLSNTMNNFRLSSYKGEKDVITASEIETLLSAHPASIPLNDGRLLNIITNKLGREISSPWLRSGIKGGSVFEIVNIETGKVYLANSLEECASIIGITRNLLSSAFSNKTSTNLPFISVGEASCLGFAEKYKIKRLGVFLCG